MLTEKIRVFGIVQGVGFRPFTAVTAEKFHIKGTVANKGSYVEIFAQGSPENINAFMNTVRNHSPERAMILEMEHDFCEREPFPEFTIIESEKETGNIFVSPDIATCDKCRAELFDPNNRRYLHPFINCTQCGPRLTILDAMPYDRIRTSMKEFPMCPECQAEYENPLSRRYDAQPVCCNNCGAEVYLLDSNLKGNQAISEVRRQIMDGKIIAIKGIGGFHLCCNAYDDNAVRRLRILKNRPMKPFAVMMKNLQTVQRECELLEGQEELLTGWQKPIMLLKKRLKTSIPESIAPDNLTVGVMLPYAPVQMLLFDEPDGISMTDCLVMTSGNARGAPICRSDEDARKEISGFCDSILSHNRKIRIRADDSVTDWLDGKPYMIRRSRGFAPLPIMLKQAGNRQVLAIGGELKNTFCIAKNGLLYASPYVGDTADIRTVTALKESISRMCGLLEAEPEIIVSDMHPMYNTVAIAEELSKEKHIPLVKIQHHYAHILSCMAENGCNEKVIGVSLDGTGYGTDGTIWGGEFLISDYQGFERVGSIQPFMQVGGDISSVEGWRIAVSLLRETLGENACLRLGLCDGQTYRIQKMMAEKRLNSVISTSCGRLFDGISAILGIRQKSTFEGESATALMTVAEGSSCGEKFNISGFTVNPIENNGFLQLPTFALAQEIAERYLYDSSDDNRQYLAYAFHAVLAEQILRTCQKIRSQSGLNICALSGGVFQNRLLTYLCKRRLQNDGFTVLLHSLIPPNDGGICIGQSAYAVMQNN